MCAAMTITVPPAGLLAVIDLDRIPGGINQDRLAHLTARFPARPARALQPDRRTRKA